MQKFLRLVRIPNRLFPVGFLLLAILFRLIWLDKIPTGISDDEMGFLLNSKAVLLTGHDLRGVWSPFSLQPITGGFPQAEIPYLLLAPVVGNLPFSLVYSKLPFVTVSVLLVLVIYLVVKELIGPEEGYIAGIVAAVNPWCVFFGRTAYEAPFAVFFYFVALYILLKAKGRLILLACIPLFIAFYSYMGTKLLFLPFIMIIGTFLYSYKRNARHIRYYIFVFSFCLFIFLHFIYSIQKQSTSQRLSELASPYSADVMNTVNLERRQSINNPLTNVFSNKYVVFGKSLIEKYYRVFSLDYLFLYGEGRSTFSLYQHGYFYYIDAVFLLMGIFVLYNRNKHVWILLISLLLISPIPAVMNTGSTGFAALRAALLYPIFIILIAIGIRAFISVCTTRKYGTAYVLTVFMIYTVSILNFSNLYFFRNPIYNSEAYNLSSRLLSRYLALVHADDHRVLVLPKNPHVSFEHYIFETDSYSRITADTIRQQLVQQTYTLHNITFSACSDELFASEDFSDRIIIIPTDSVCDHLTEITLSEGKIIAQLADGGAVYTIYNDPLCKGFKLNKYPDNFYLSDFSIENMSAEHFCRKFITDPGSAVQ